MTTGRARRLEVSTTLIIFSMLFTDTCKSIRVMIAVPCSAPTIRTHYNETMNSSNVECSYCLQRRHMHTSHQKEPIKFIEDIKRKEMSLYWKYGGPPNKTITLTAYAFYYNERRLFPLPGCCGIPALDEKCTFESCEDGMHIYFSVNYNNIRTVIQDQNPFDKVSRCPQVKRDITLCYSKDKCFVYDIIAGDYHSTIFDDLFMATGDDRRITSQKNVEMCTFALDEETVLSRGMYSNTSSRAFGRDVYILNIDEIEGSYTKNCLYSNITGPRFENWLTNDHHSHSYPCVAIKLNTQIQNIYIKVNCLSNQESTKVQNQSLTILKFALPIVSVILVFIIICLIFRCQNCCKHQTKSMKTDTDEMKELKANSTA